MDCLSSSHLYLVPHCIELSMLYHLLLLFSRDLDHNILNYYRPILLMWYALSYLRSLTLFHLSSFYHPLDKSKLVEFLCFLIHLSLLLVLVLPVLHSLKIHPQNGKYSMSFKWLALPYCALLSSLPFLLGELNYSQT